MPVLQWPEDLAAELRRLKLMVDRLFTASQRQEAFTKLVARQMLVGSEDDRRLIFNPDNSSVPEIQLWPGKGGNYSRIWSDDATFPTEATFRITSGTNQAGTASAQMVVAAGLARLQILDESGSSDNGGILDVAENYARIGWVQGGGNDSEFYFRSSGHVQLSGAWYDYAVQGSNAGLLVASVTIASGSGGATLSYGTSMSHNMAPIVGLRDGAGSANFNWCITASSSSSFTVSWSNTTGKAVYFSSFSHG
jgi:hypothetical protein